MKIFIYLVILILVPDGLIAQSIDYKDRTYDPRIKTVEFYRQGWRLSVPYRNLSDTTRLILEFDDLSDRVEMYTYTVIHCTPDWQPTDISETEYLTGLPEYEIRDYQYSRNTLQPYIHYRLTFPNEQTGIRISGNYILYVYRNYNRDEPILTRRFYIIEPLTPIKADIHRTDNLNHFSTTQEVDFSLDYSSLSTDNPARDIRVAVLQNFDWSTAITSLYPKYIHPEALVYDFEEQNLFPGGSEFRHFDTKSLRFNSDRVAEIRFIPPVKHVFLKPDRPGDSKYYVFQEDLSGRFLVKWDDAHNSDIEADYLMIHFTLELPEPISGGHPYVFGSLTQWDCIPEFKMEFDPATSRYVLQTLVKQGYYNYQYRICDEDGIPIRPNPVEPDFYQTLNDYTIFVYFKDIRSRFYRLTGLETFPSYKTSSGL